MKHQLIVDSAWFAKGVILAGSSLTVAIALLITDWLGGLARKWARAERRRVRKLRMPSEEKARLAREFRSLIDCEVIR